MSEKQNKQDSFSHEIDKKVKRKLKAERNSENSVWSGFALFGIVGWSIVVPTLMGAILGIWLDKSYGQSFSWTISLLLAGLVTGCFMAWKWIDKENKEIHKNDE